VFTTCLEGMICWIFTC